MTEKKEVRKDEVSVLRQITGSEYTKDWWWQLSSEERSWAIYKMYNNHVFTADEVSPFLMKDRLNTIFTQVLPLALFPLSYKLLPNFLPSVCRGGCKRTMWTVSFLAAVPFVVAWRNWNPFRTGLTAEKERLLNLAFKRVGGSHIVNSNELLPRWMTEFEIHRRLRVLRNRKNGVFAGILYPPEEHKAMEIDIDPFVRRSSKVVTL